MSDLVIGDADAVIALFSRKDSNHERAREFLTLLDERGVSLYFPVTAVGEAITASQRKLSDSLLAETIVKRMNGGSMAVLPVDGGILEIASVLFNPHGSKQNTFFDAIIGAVAKKYEAVAIFSFDEWYSKQGFRLVSELSF